MAEPRVLFVINSLAGGGAERVMTTLLAQTVSEGRREAIGLALLDRDLLAYPPPAGLPLHQLNARGSLLSSFLQLLRLCRTERPSIIVSFLTRANVAAILVAKCLGARVVVSERVATSSHLSHGLGGKMARLLVRATYPLADRIIAVSQGVADDLQTHFGIAPRGVRVVANPVDVGRLRIQGTEAPELEVFPPFVVGVGRLAANKNFALLLRAFASARIEGRLVILGEGPERGSLQALAHELKIADRLDMPGYLANPFAVVQRAKLYVLPSNAEGFPNGLVEAMALGRPVIATNCASGPSEILADLPRTAVAGLTLAPHGVLTPANDVATMAQALRRLWNDDPLRERYGKKAAERADRYGVARATEGYWRAILEA